MKTIAFSFFLILWVAPQWAFGINPEAENVERCISLTKYKNESCSHSGSYNTRLFLGCSRVAGKKARVNTLYFKGVNGKVRACRPPKMSEAEGSDFSYGQIGGKYYQISHRNNRLIVGEDLEKASEGAFQGFLRVGSLGVLKDKFSVQNIKMFDRSCRDLDQAWESYTQEYLANSVPIPPVTMAICESQNSMENCTAFVAENRKKHQDCSSLIDQLKNGEGPQNTNEGRPAVE